MNGEHAADVNVAAKPDSPSESSPDLVLGLLAVSGVEQDGGNDSARDKDETNAFKRQCGSI